MPVNDDLFHNSRRTALNQHNIEKTSKCYLCGKKAIYRTGPRGYCSEHKVEAQKDMKRLQQQRDYNARNNHTDNWKDEA